MAEHQLIHSWTAHSATFQQSLASGPIITGTKFHLPTLFLLPALILRWPFDLCFAYNQVYALSVHGTGHHRIIGIYHSEYAARIAFSEIVGLPEYMGRPWWPSFGQVRDLEPGAVHASMGGAGGCGRDLRVVIERLLIRGSGW